MFRLMSVIFSLMLASQAFSAPIFIFMGGFGSCPLNGETSEIKSGALMDNLMAKARETYGDDIVEIRTCYAFGSERIFVSAPGLGLNSSAMTRDELSQRVLEATTTADESPIYLWGQSHGGWTALDLVRRLPQLRFRVLNTVDPISISDCGPAVFIGGVLSGSAPGCRGAPRDLEPSYAQISKSVAHWTNWYQTEFPLLHSGVIGAAKENVERSFNASWWIPMGAHRLMETDPVMWQNATTRIIDDLKIQSAKSFN